MGGSPGRPKGSGTKGRTQAFVVRLREEQWRDLKYFVADRHSTMADEVMIAIERHIRDERAKEQGQAPARP